MVFCGNNIYSPVLKANGGHYWFGTHSECFKKGYAAGYRQTVNDVPRFMDKWLGKYRAHIVQKLWHSDDPVPPGYQLATLAQTMGRGFAFGSIGLAKKLAKEARAKTKSQKQGPTLPLKTVTQKPSQLPSSPRPSHLGSAATFQGCCAQRCSGSLSGRHPYRKQQTERCDERNALNSRRYLASGTHLATRSQHFCA